MESNKVFPSEEEQLERFDNLVATVLASSFLTLIDKERNGMIVVKDFTPMSNRINYATTCMLKRFIEHLDELPDADTIDPKEVSKLALKTLSGLYKELKSTCDDLYVTVDSFEPSDYSDEESNGSDNDIDKEEEPSSCIKDSDYYAAK